jgi:phosphopantetheinyl transferase
LPRYREIYIKKEAKIIIWKIEESEQDLILMLGNYEIPESFYKYRSESHRKQFLATQNLLKSLGLLGKLKKDHNGKPLLSNGFISISHDTDYVAVMVSEKLCGIDLQHVSEKVLRIKHKFYDENDASIVGSEIHFMTMVWSVKEALYKLHGDPLVYFKEHLRIEYLDRYKSIAEILKPNYAERYDLEIRRVDNIFLAYTI